MLVLTYRSFYSINQCQSKDLTRKAKAKTSKGKAKTKAKAGILWPRAKVKASKGKVKPRPRPEFSRLRPRPRQGLRHPKARAKAKAGDLWPRAEVKTKTKASSMSGRCTVPSESSVSSTTTAGRSAAALSAWHSGATR